MNEAAKRVGEELYVKKRHLQVPPKHICIHNHALRIWNIFLLIRSLLLLNFFIGSGIYFKRSLTLKDLSKNANVCLNLTSLRETNQDLLPAKRGSCTLKRERRTPSETEKRNQLPKVRGQKVAPTFGYGKCFLILVFLCVQRLQQIGSDVLR